MNLSMVLILSTDSVKTPELDGTFVESDAIGSSVTSSFLYLVSTLSDNSKPQLAASIKAHKF